MVFASYVGLLDRAREVQHGEQREHAGLDERNQYAEAEDGNLQEIGKQEETEHHAKGDAEHAFAFGERIGKMVERYRAAAAPERFWPGATMRISPSGSSAALREARPGDSTPSSFVRTIKG